MSSPCDADPGHAAALALASAATADDVHNSDQDGAGTYERGRALAYAGEGDPAIAELRRAAAELDACGANLA